MTTKALIFGSIGTLADTSDLQRRAFNAAFDEAGLGWNWEEAEYTELLKKSGGRQRIADYADRMGVTVDAGAVHDAKVRHFERLVKEEGIAPRPGVCEVIAAAKAVGVKLGFATSTTPQTVGLLMSGLFPTIPRSTFDWIGDAEAFCVARGAELPQWTYIRQMS